MAKKFMPIVMCLSLFVLAGCQGKEVEQTVREELIRAADQKLEQVQDSGAQKTLPDAYSKVVNKHGDVIDFTAAKEYAQAKSSLDDLTILADDTVAKANRLRRKASRRPEVHVVKSGDWLSKIVRDKYNGSITWQALYDANKDTIKNPNLIYPGQKFRVPVK